MALLFHSPDEDAQAWRRALQRRAPGLDVRVWPDAGELAEIDAALVWRAPPGLLGSLPNLRLILSLGAGVDAMLADPTLPDLPLCRLVDPSLTRMMGEFVLTWYSSTIASSTSSPASSARRAGASPCRRSRARPRSGILGLGELGTPRRRPAAAHGLRRPRLEPHAQGDRGRRRLRRSGGAGRVPGRHRRSWSACCR